MMANPTETTLLNKYGRLNTKLQAQLVTLNQLLKSQGAPMITWTTKMNHMRVLIKSMNEDLESVPYSPTQAVEDITQTI